LQNQVVRLQPRNAPFETALEAFRAGQYVSCARALHGHDGLAERSLRARCLVRLDREEDALTLLKALPGLGEAPHLARARALFVRAAASTRLNRLMRAEEDLAAARVHVYSSSSVQLEAEFEYHTAFLRWCQGDYAEADSAARRVLELDAGAEDDPSFALSIATSRALAVQMLAFSAGREGRLRAQVDLMLHALAELDCGERPEPFVEARILQNLATVVCELDLPPVAALVRERSAKLAWTAELAEQQSGVLRSLGWSAALQGDHLGALRDMRLAGEVATTPGLRLLALVDRAFLARELSQMILAEEELRLAQELSATIDWARCEGDESLGLLSLAHMTAERDSELAQSWLDRYDALRSRGAALPYGRLEQVVRASELFARGKVAIADGQQTRGVTLLTEAFELWTSIGCRWRAAVAANELFTDTRLPKFGDFVALEAGKRPTSWLGRLGNPSREFAPAFAS
jgi:tetratricopeptide (TPR) repeat protein